LRKARPAHGRCLRAVWPAPADLLALHRRSPAEYPFLLQSVAGHPLSGRYDILFAFPERALTTSDSGSTDFLAQLSEWVRTEGTIECPGDLPFSGGWFLLLGYELARQVEPVLQLPASPFRLPDALAVRCPAAVIYDRELGQCHLVAERRPEQISRMREDLERVARSNPAAAGSGGRALVTGIIEEPAERFTSGVRRILEYLGAGDVFQVNLSRAWSGQLAAGCSALDLYDRLRVSNPAPFAGLVRWGQSVVISSSPERLVEVSGDGVQTRPIAGTRPRGADAGSDRVLREQLVDSLKERAEHIMLIDLERNDLGRVCKPGTVTVSELMTVESYAHVHHIVSNVRGTLRAGIGPGEVLRAVFPGGTITGCPKVRAMQIIAELEGEGRGPYTGAMGYLSRDGRLDANILIRSLICENGRVSLRAGAGIVADSDPGAELAETRAKARGLLNAFGAGP
jgi:anthranilate synthase component I